MIAIFHLSFETHKIAIFSIFHCVWIEQDKNHHTNHLEPKDSKDLEYQVPEDQVLDLVHSVQQ